MIEKSILICIEKQLNAKIIDSSGVGGDGINDVYCLDTEQGKLLVKVNNSKKLRDMFVREAEGLAAIRETKTIAVPGVILQGDIADYSFLVLDWIITKRPTERNAALLGEQLAQMHKNSGGNFGFATDNYMGSLAQSNKSHALWSNFFIHERLEPMVKLAVDHQYLTNIEIANFEQLYKNLPDLYDAEQPALIHGDLWGGNYLIGDDDKPYLIDPAVSYGHREFDIAMTRLFGGFSPAFYDAYNAVSPLVKGWEQRVELWNLYPLLLHLNLFGMSYKSQVIDSLRRFT